jgi:hypothetical protein
VAGERERRHAAHGIGGDQSTAITVVPQRMARLFLELRGGLVEVGVRSY